MPEPIEPKGPQPPEPGIPIPIDEDRIEVKKINSIVPIYDAEGKTKYWAVETPTPEGTKIWNLERIGPDPERLIIASHLASAALSSYADPMALTTCSRFYKPVSHQRLLSFFHESLKKTYPTAPLEPTHKYEQEWFYRMINVYTVDEYEVYRDKLHFGVTLTNSYDLSLGVHLDGYLWYGHQVGQETRKVGFFLGIAGSWKSNFRHYWGSDKVKAKIDIMLKTTTGKAIERVQTIEKLAGTIVSAEIVTLVGRALGLHKREVEDKWNQLFPQMPAIWEKKAGFTVPQSAPITAWAMIKQFALFATYVDRQHELDIARNLLDTVISVMKNYGKVVV